MLRRVVITGIGVVTPIGTGIRDFWEGVRAGRRGVRPLTRFDASGLKTRIAGDLHEMHELLRDYSTRSCGRSSI